MADPTPLTPEEEANLRATVDDIGRYPAHAMWARDVRRLLATLDAARQPDPEAGLREAALAAVKATGCIRVFWGARKPCDDPIYNGDRDLCAICALRAALAPATPEADHA